MKDAKPLSYEHSRLVCGTTRSERLSYARCLGRHTQYEWEAMKIIHNYSCAKCGDDNPYGGITKDHIIPIHRGGSDSISNIQPLCQRCNSGKNDFKDHRIPWKRKLSKLLKMGIDDG